MKMPEQSQKLLLVVFLPQEWARYHRRPYWEALAKHVNVLVVEPPAGLLFLWLHPKRLTEYFRYFGRVRQGENNLHFYRPLLLATPGIDFRIPFLGPFDRILIRRQLSERIKRMKFQFQETVLFLVHVQQSLFSGLIRKAKQCYEITDLYTIAIGHHQINHNHWYTKRAKREDKKIANRSDIIITSSKLIYDGLKTSSGHAYYLQNAADYEHFSKSENDNLKMPDDINKLPRPRLGFIGYVNHLIDFELLSQLASEFANASIVLIGGDQNETGIQNDVWYQKVKSARNVHYLGFRDYELLPAYLKAFDICLMPFRLNDWMMHSAPNKTYQYLASGKPIVSTDFTEIRQYENVVYIAKNHDEFIAQVKLALCENNEEKKAARQKVAIENSTVRRAEKVMEIIRYSKSTWNF